MRFLFYSHDGLGLGHTRRNLALAAALTQLSREARILLATGVDEIHDFGVPDNVDTLKLPRIYKGPSGDYRARRLGILPSDIRRLRSKLLAAAVESFRPSVLVVDKHPVGAAGELREGLKVLRQQGGRAVLGLRDVLDDGKTVMKEWAEHDLIDQIATFYDRVLIYGHPWLFDVAREYNLPSEIIEKSRFCGYVVTPENGSPHQFSDSGPKPCNDVNNGSRPTVLATAGGGEDGFFVLETFLRACRDVPWRGIAVAGPMIPPHEFKILEQLAAEANANLHRFLPRLSSLFCSIDTLVCMGGYNTLAEAMAKAVPTVCVPRVSPRREQLIRANAFASAGLSAVIHPDELNVETLQKKIAVALATSRSEIFKKVSLSLRLNGAEEAARHILALARRKEVQTEEALVQ
jgi:predicted glycosyltransferase